MFLEGNVVDDQLANLELYSLLYGQIFVGSELTILSHLLYVWFYNYLFIFGVLQVLTYSLGFVI